jgi:hypothetical protein
VPELVNPPANSPAAKPAFQRKEQRNFGITPKRIDGRIHDSLS